MFEDTGTRFDPTIQRTGLGPGGNSDRYAAARQAIWREKWDAGLKEFEAANAAGAPPSAEDRLLAEIARIRLADDDDTAASLGASLIHESNGEAPVRRFLVSYFLKSGRMKPMAAVLEKLLEAYPHLVDVRRYLVSALARLGRLDEAIQHMDTFAATAPDDLSLQAGRIQFRLLAGQNADAASIALELKPRLGPESKEAHIVMLALVRGGLTSEAASVAATLDPRHFPTHQVATSATHALFAAGLTKQAIAAGEAAITGGHDTGALRAQIGEAILRGGRPQEITTRAIEHLSAGIALAPEDKRINALYGEALLHAGRHEEAVGFLEKANRPGVKSPMTRGLYARALRYNGRYSEAADQYLQLLERTPDRWATHRQAVGALTQAGRHEEASKIFQEMIAKRGASLGPTFEAALAELPSKLATAPIPQARLDWAWGLRRGQDDVDRAEWERRARWGLLSDLLIIDWLECREHQAEEAMALMADLGEADRIFEPLRGRGFIIATAHVGPLFSGPILLELCGLPSRWVASTPSIADAHYAASVISIAHQTEAKVAWACLKALQSGYAVAIALDGSSKMGSSTIRFEGQDINYSSFAAQVVHKLRIPSLFYAPRWEDGRLAYQFEHLPLPEPDEELRAFAVRWRDAFLGHLRDHLAGAPENLRLAGGLWSCIRSGS
jgi:tetratricopeptide (TPR) repeat protein